MLIRKQYKKLISLETYIKEKIQHFFHYWRSKRYYSRFFTNNRESIVNLSGFNVISIKNDSIQHFDVLKSGIKDGTEVTFNLSSNMIDDSNDESNFPYRIILTRKQASKISEAFTNNSSG